MKNYFKTMALALIGLVLSMNLASASTQNATALTGDKPLVLMPTTNIKSAKGSTEGGAAINAFNGSGLDAYGLKHDNTSATAWRTSNGTGIAPQDYKYVAVQFNEPVDLAKMHIWNFNWENYSIRGIKDLEVWVSSSTEDNVLASKCEEGSTVWTKAISTTLTQASANNDYTGEDVVLEQTMNDVRWVIFLCVSNYGGDAGYCGLSEVQFYADPQPQNLVCMPTTNVAAAFSSGAPAKGREAINAFNASGLTDNGDGTYKHNTSANNVAWTTSNTTDQTKQDSKQWLAVKFNEPIDLAKLHIWNLNWSEYPDRDLKDVEVYVSTSTADDLYNTQYNDPSGVWTLATTLDLQQAPATNDYTGEDYVLAYTHPNVTWVMFRILTNYCETVTSGAHYCGLSEVQFYADPQPQNLVCMPTTNVAAAFSSGAPTEGREAINAFNASGLTDNQDGTFSHEAAADNKAWVTANGTGKDPHDAQWIAVQFKSPVNIAKLHVWNLNWLSSYLNRGVKDIEVYVSSNTATDLYATAYSDAKWTKVTTATLAQASGEATYTGEDVAFASIQKNVSWVLFRCTSNHGANASYYGLSEVQFYVKPSDDSWVSVREGLTAGTYGTLCWQHNLTAIEGAELYSIEGKENDRIVLKEVKADETQAGVGYIFLATATTLRVKNGENSVEVPLNAFECNGLQGTFEDITDGAAGTQNNTLEGNYIIYNNEWRLCSGYTGLLANRAYLILNEIPGAAPAPAPGRKYISMPLPNDAPMQLSNQQQTIGNRVVLVLKDGQFRIIRDGKTYNVHGQIIQE